MVSPMVSLEVGQRCCCDGFFATVRFVGEVPPSKGIWVGVEWDDPTRGKHDGTKEGVRYFTCSHPTGGSFVRPAKLRFGRSFCETIKARYGSNQEQTDAASQSDHPVDFDFLGGAKRSTEIQSHFDQLENVHLSKMSISSAGPSGDVLKMCPNIVNLDMSGNLLNNWREVADITIQLPHLVSLNVSDNKLVLPAAGDGRRELVDAFGSIQSLYVIRMDLDLHQLLDIAEIMSSLRHLHACENKITGLRTPCAEGERAAAVFSALESLNLEENQLSDWADVLVLIHLKELRTLILNDNQFTDIYFPTDEVVFPALSSLSMYRNKIKSWSSVCALGSLHALTELKFKDNPVLQGDSELIGRQLTVAHLHRLTRLNSSEVSEKERAIAEHYYLRRFSADYAKASSGDQSSLLAFNREHPRFVPLVKLHGLPEESLWHPNKSQTSSSSGVLKNRLLSLKLVFPEDSSKPQITKKLPDTMTIQKLKVLLQHFFKVDVSDQSLSYISGKNDFEVELDDNLKQLSFYAIKSGDTVVLKRQ